MNPEPRLDLLCMLPYIVIIFLALPLLLDPNPKYHKPSRRPPTHPPGWHNRKKGKRK